MSIHVHNKDELAKQLAEAGNKLVVIDFFATWCGPCKRIAPFFEEFATKHAGKIVLLKVDTDECEDLAAEYEVKVMPTFVLLRNGKKLETVSGSSEENLESKVTANIDA